MKFIIQLIFFLTWSVYSSLVVLPYEVNIYPKDADSYFRMGEIYLDEEWYEKAIPNFTKAIELNRQYEKAYLKRGIAYSYLEQLDLAIADFTKAIELDPTEPLAYFSRGGIYFMKRQHPQVISDMTMALELDSKDDRFYSLRGISYTALGENDKAISDFSKSIAINPQDHTFYDLRGLAYIEKEDYENAITDFNKEIQIDQYAEEGYFNIGTIFIILGKYDKAILDFKQAIKINQKNEYNYLHLLNATWLLKADDNEAIEILRNYVSSNESNEWVRNISKFYLGIDGTKEADVFEEANKGENDQIIKERLCEAYYYLGIRQLINGNRKIASAYFSKSIATNISEFVEYKTAKALFLLINK